MLQTQFQLLNWSLMLSLKQHLELFELNRTLSVLLQSDVSCWKDTLGHCVHNASIP